MLFMNCRLRFPAVCSKALPIFLIVNSSESEILWCTLDIAEKLEQTPILSNLKEISKF